MSLKTQRASRYSFVVDAGCPPRLRAISALGTLQDMIYWENQSPNLLYRLLVRMEHPYNVV